MARLRDTYPGRLPHRLRLTRPLHLVALGRDERRAGEVADGVVTTARLAEARRAARRCRLGERREEACGHRDGREVAAVD